MVDMIRDRLLDVALDFARDLRRVKWDGFSLAGALENAARLARWTEIQNRSARCHVFEEFPGDGDNVPLLIEIILDYQQQEIRSLGKTDSVRVWHIAGHVGHLAHVLLRKYTVDLALDPTDKSEADSRGKFRSSLQQIPQTGAENAEYRGMMAVQ